MKQARAKGVRRAALLAMFAGGAVIVAAPLAGAQEGSSTTTSDPCLITTTTGAVSPSTSEANRLIEGGGVRIDGAVISDKGLKVEAGTCVVQVGKRKFAKVTLA